MWLLSCLYNAQSWLLFLLRWCIFALLLSASWYVHPFFSLVCFVPYFITLFRNKVNAAWYVQLFILNLTWNAAITYWLVQLDVVRGVAALVANSVLFLIPVILWRLYIKYGRIQRAQPLALLLWWLLFEYVHHLWDFSWTWLTVGNVFGQATGWVQWYAWLGVLSGSAWILLSNYLLYQLPRQPFTIKKLYLPSCVIALPMLVSVIMGLLQQPDPTQPEAAITAIATNNRAEEERSDLQKVSLIDAMAALDTTPKGITLLPEVLLSDEVWISRFAMNDTYRRLKQGLTTWKTNHIITGAMINVPDEGGIHTEERGQLQQRFSRYNAALMIDASDTLSIKLKKVYVPITEYVPSYLSFLNVKTYGFAKDPYNADHFEIDGRQYFVGICYEVVNSVFIANSLKENTSAILMLSSESFFGKSEIGRQQYRNICRLRALENKLPLVKSSNDGIVMAVNANGSLQQATRTTGNPYVLHASIRLSTPSVYHVVANYLPYALIILLCTIIALHKMQKPLTKVVASKQSWLPLFRSA